MIDPFTAGCFAVALICAGAGVWKAITLERDLKNHQRRDISETDSYPQAVEKDSAGQAQD